MPAPSKDVACTCAECNGKLVSRAKERRHRRKATKLYLRSTNHHPQRTPITDFPSDSESFDDNNSDSTTSHSSMPPVETAPPSSDAEMLAVPLSESEPFFDNSEGADSTHTFFDASIPESASAGARIALPDDDDLAVWDPLSESAVDVSIENMQHRHLNAQSAVWEVPDELTEDEDSDTDSLLQFDTDEEEEDEELSFDWDHFRRAGEDGRLSALDQLGAEYQSFVSSIREKLTAHDVAICKAYAYKLQSHTTDTDFRKIPYAFPRAFEDDELPALDEMRSRIAFLSGFTPERYDCCINSCICYCGPHEERTSCPFCDEPRYRKDGKARKTFTYLPLIPRLTALLRNPTIAKQLQYRHEYKYDSEEIHDVFDCRLYRHLRKKYIQAGDKQLPRKYYEDPRDIALGLSTDGFAPFKRRRHTAWPLIVFLYNLPPEVRFHLDNILSLGVVPGPKKPKDMCSFLWPLCQELLKLAEGTKAFDVLRGEWFPLRAFPLLVFGDIPAISMLMRMKGHNGFAPCRMCNITGVSIPGAAATTLYVPLDRSTHPDVIADPSATSSYDPLALPLRTHKEFGEQAVQVDDARTDRESDRLARLYGIKGLPILYHIKSLLFPYSFPYDFMHLIYENLVPNLILLMTGKFKGLDNGNEQYDINSATWQAIGELTAASGSTIPGAYGARVPNIAKDGVSISAEMYSMWIQFIGPVLLRRHFHSQAYYDHFITLVQLLSRCLQFTISRADIKELRIGFGKWVEDFERIYYQYDPSRVSTCPVTIHALLHIADSIEIAGPVWCYWAFPMERYCGRLQPGIRSRRFPFASLDRYVLETAQMTQIAVLYNLREELSLRAPKGEPRGSRRLTAYPSALLLGPHKPLNKLPSRVIGALGTRFNLDKSIKTVKQVILKNAVVTEWAKVRRVDSDEGDTMVASKYPSDTLANREDRRDATFVRYSMLVDINANRRTAPSVWQEETFYGQLLHIYLIELKNEEPLPQYQIFEPNTCLIMVEIESCKIDELEERLDIHFYSSKGRVHPTDVTSLQCLIGRVPDNDGSWGIIDRSGTLARAVYLGDSE